VNGAQPRESDLTFDSPGMQSHYAALDLYQQIGARLCLVGADWNMDHLYDDPEAVAQAIGALYETSDPRARILLHSILDAGQRARQRLPPHPRLPLEHFTRIHQLVKAEFARRGLAIEIIGSDDADAAPSSRNASGTRPTRTNRYLLLTYLPALNLHAGRVPESSTAASRPSAPTRRTARSSSAKWAFSAPGSPRTTTAHPYLPLRDLDGRLAIEGLNAASPASRSGPCTSLLPFGKKMQFGLWISRTTTGTYADLPCLGRLLPPRAPRRPGPPLRLHAAARVLGALVGATLFFVNRGDQPPGCASRASRPARRGS